MRAFIKSLLRSCGLCFGTGVRELPNGSTIECRNCKGKGII